MWSAKKNNKINKQIYQYKATVELNKEHAIDLTELSNVNNIHTTHTQAIFILSSSLLT